VVKAGGQPWCVKTCPSQALKYGLREEILTEAKERLAMLQQRYPNARIYGETEAGGLGVIMVLPDEPEKLNLPANPDVPLALNAWQNFIQPVSMGLTGLSVVVTGLAAVIARRNHMKEVEQIHMAEAAAAQPEDADGSAVTASTEEEA
jgi:formate dehydrogenase iron-sulfur subunit